MTDETQQVVAGVILISAIGLFMATCTAHAAEQQARIRNADTARPIAAVRLCDAAGCQPEVVVAIAPGATAAVRFPTAPSGRTIHPGPTPLRIRSSASSMRSGRVIESSPLKGRARQRCRV